MKKVFLVIGLLLTSLLLPVISLACGTVFIPAPLGQQFTLPAGKTVAINSENLNIKFVEVTADSRCASDVVCIVAGEAKCLMLIKLWDSVSSITLTVGGNNTQTFNQYTFKYDLQPYPVSTQQIKPSDYKLIMTVNKN
jgi:hypothetical protein